MAKREQGQVLPTYILWTHSENKEGLHPVKIRVNHHRVTKYYPVMTPEKKKVFLSVAEYTHITQTELKKLRDENRVTRKILDQAVTDAETAIKATTTKNTKGDKKPFSFAEFERKYLGEDASKNFLASFKKHIDKLSRKGQAGTARAYSSAYSALHEFQNGRDLDPANLTVQKLEEFDEWLRTPRPQKSNPKKTTKPLNDTSVSIYMRCLRSVYNEMAAIDEYLISIYPFSKKDNDRKYKIPTAGGGQKGITLSINDISSFINGEVDGDEIPENPMYRAKQLFLFSFFAQGINFKDMALLKFADVGNDTITFNREKTIRTKKEPTKIRIPLTDELNAILIEQGNSKRHPNNFVFEVFDSNTKYSKKQEDDTIRQWVKTTNKWLKRYCEKNQLPEVSTYSARHSFASIAKTHLPVVQISKMLGHSRITTTQSYLGRFEDDENRSGLMKVFNTIKKKSA